MWSSCLRLRVCGRPSTSATLLIVKVFSMGVSLYNSVRMLSGSYPCLRVMRRRRPFFRSDRSTALLMPVIFLSLMAVPMLLNTFSGPTMYGNSVTVIVDRFPVLVVSIVTFARVVKDPLPVS